MRNNIEWKTLGVLVKRNSKMFFKDKGIFFTSLITPLILLVLYATFLANVYRDSFLQAMPEGIPVSDKLLNGMVGGQLLSSLLAVCCVTVSFCANMLMVQDKALGTRSDLTVSPVKNSTLALGYYLSTTLTTLAVSLIATLAGLLYIAICGWYMSVGDICLLLLDVFLVSAFGTALSSVINFFLSSQGQISAVGSIVSSGYGFICGAYMPISQFGAWLRNAVAFLPGTYGTSLLRNHALNGVLEEMTSLGFPSEAITGIKDTVDCNIYCFGACVPQGVMYAILALSVVVLVGVYILLNVLRERKNTK